MGKRLSLKLGNSDCKRKNPSELSPVDLDQTRSNELLSDKTCKLVEERMVVAMACVSERRFTCCSWWQSCKI